MTRYLLLFLFLLPITTIMAHAPPLYQDCDPCIRRSDFVLKAVVHGTQLDPFWQSTRAAMQQAALDMGVTLKMELYESYTAQQMVNDIGKATRQEERIDALVVTIPSQEVQEAIKEAVQSGLPVFGFNLGYEVFEDLGVISFVAQEEYIAGVMAAEEFLRVQETELGNNNSTSKSLQTALFVNHQKGIQGLEERYQGFKDTLVKKAKGRVYVKELAVDLNRAEDMQEKIENALQGCNYNMILAAGLAALPKILDAAETYGCYDTDTTIATFDFSQQLQKNILLDQLAFALDQQEYLQAAFPVVLATIYATTSSAIVPTLRAKTYLSGPIVVNQINLPPDSQMTCEEEAFPVCSNENQFDGLHASCSCIDRSKIRIGGVTHGHTTDVWWDPVYLASDNAAKDMGIVLQNERLSPEEDSGVFIDKMAAKMKSICEGGIDGLFVTIQDADVIYDAIKVCQRLNVPVIAINSNPILSKKAGVPHIGQDEYGAGYLSGQRMVEAGMTEGYCHGQKAYSGVTARCAGFLDAVGDAGLYATEIEAPQDLDARFTHVFEEAVGREDDNRWTGVGMLVGARTLASTLTLQEQHPDLLIGMSDVGSYGDIIFKAMDEGKLLFTFDQQPFLQGNLPVYLLTYMAYTKQMLLDDLILTGPSFITYRPTPEQQACETNMWPVCANIPEEDLNYISKGWLSVGYFLAAMTIIFGVVSLAWLFYYREKAVVKASQPPFLAMLAIGGIVSGCAIVAMGIETDYRTTIDPFTGEITGTNEDVGKVDAACMLVPWLYGLGFCLMFSALLAKIWRVKLVYKAAMEMRRQQIGYYTTLPVLAAMFAVELIILMSWQVASPLVWTREVTTFSYDGHPLESVGSCNSDSGWFFMAGLVGYHVLCLFYALILCWQARHIPPDFADSNWVSLSVIMIFQVSILAIPIAAMVQDETNAFYFVRACALFLQSFTVLCLIFVPKMYKIIHGNDRVSVTRLSKAHSIRSADFKTPSQSLRSTSYMNHSRRSNTAANVSPCCQAGIQCSSCGLAVGPGNEPQSPEAGPDPISEEQESSRSLRAPRRSAVRHPATTESTAREPSTYTVATREPSTQGTSAESGTFAPPENQ